MNNESILPEIYRLENKNEQQMKEAFIHFMSDKEATPKQISEPTRSRNYANLDNDDRIIKAVVDVTDYKNAYSIKSPVIIDSISKELTRLANESGDLKQKKEYKNRRSYINKYRDFLNYCLGLKSTASSQLPYSYSSDPDKPFINELKFNEIVALLKRKKNVILEGAPGVGKTFLARKVAYQLIGEIKDENIEMVQFHQSYGYEDFVQGIRPMANGEFKTRDGVFYEFCTKAQTSPKDKFVFLIDEINRGNISKILGELMMLIEANKRSPKYAIKLTYSDPEDEKFYVPDNVYILGCMNTADRSLAIVDYALRRRFAFYSIEPEFGQTFTDFLCKKFEKVFVEDICERLNKANDIIRSHRSLGKGMEIGHSYFCDFNGTDDANGWWEAICKYEICPYIREICFDDEELANQICKELTE
ncbi:MAG: AAA family ATPase [Bacteroidaceae bacterium]|nr:AAA family ATPase [Bacteroidaceae bacterium]